MSGSDAQDTARLERQRLIERLNAREAELAEARGERPRLPEEALEADIERERQRNYVHMGFAQMSG